MGESSLRSRRNVACLIFFQKIVHGKVHSLVLLHELKLLVLVPCVVAKSIFTFYCARSNTVHNLNSPELRCMKLYNNLCINDDNFSSKTVKNMLIAPYNGYN